MDGGNIMVDQVRPIWRFYSGGNEELCDLKQNIPRTQARRNGTSTAVEGWDSVTVLAGERIFYGQTLVPSLWSLDYSNSGAPDTGFPQQSHSGSKERLSASQRRTCLPRRDFRQFWLLVRAPYETTWATGGGQQSTFRPGLLSMHPSRLYLNLNHTSGPRRWT